MLINSAIFLHCILVSTMFLQPKARQHPQEPEELFSNSNANAPPVPPRSSASSSLVTSPSASASSSSPLVPAFFIIGDSSVDCGNNNFLGTLARADRLPYGRDFDTHKPTGRFCNGRIPVDYLGILSFLDSVWLLGKWMCFWASFFFFKFSWVHNGDFLDFLWLLRKSRKLNGLLGFLWFFLF